MTEPVGPTGGAPAKAKGRIISFYSYKGGTGRSMAVANVAWMLALNNNRVLVIDWDLEAPGLHRYFHPFLEDKELLSTEGLIDMVESLAAQAATSSTPLSPEQVDIIPYIEPLEWPRNSAYPLSWKQFGPRARIDLLPAGRQGPAYSRKLSAFNWIDFYERLGGRRLLEAARNQMRGIYDYVLIDSRTGVSDTSGICTVEMPDTLVICFTLNDQSIRGASAIAESVREHRSSTSNQPAANAPTKSPGTVGPFRIFPVPTRVEITAEHDKRETALDLAQRTFTPFLDHLPPDLHGPYWGAVKMAYFPYYAFEEIPAVFGDKPHEKLSLSTAIKEITRAITDPPVAELPPLAGDRETAEQIRKEIVGWYLRPNLRAQPDADAAQLRKAAEEAHTRAAQLEAVVAKQRAELGAGGGQVRSGWSRWLPAVYAAGAVVLAGGWGMDIYQQRVAALEAQIESIKKAGTDADTKQKQGQEEMARALKEKEAEFARQSQQLKAEADPKAKDLAVALAAGKRTGEPAQRPATDSSRVIVSYAEPTDFDFFFSLIDGIRPTFPEVRKGNSLPGNTPGEVRYFYAGDKGAAIKVESEIVAFALKNRGIRLNLAFRALDSKESPDGKPGTIEVRLPQLSSRQAGSAR